MSLSACLSDPSMHVMSFDRQKRFRCEEAWLGGECDVPPLSPLSKLAILLPCSMS